MRNKKLVVAAMMSVAVMAVGCGAKTNEVQTSTVKEETAVESAAGTEQTAQKSKEASKVAAADETVSQSQVVTEGMTPIYGQEIRDGVYTVQVDSSSSMFKVTDCKLTVKDGTMTAVMTMAGTGYLQLYMGTGEEAVNAPEQDYIPYTEKDGVHSYKIPVEALDKGIACSAYSKKKEMWYDRTLVFRADSIPSYAYAEGTIKTVKNLNLADGIYDVDVSLEGGSGKAYVESPATLRIENGEAYATIEWSSANYDYMKVDGEKYELLDEEGNSTFEIPVTAFDFKIPVLADTIAMSTPHEIEYTLKFDSKSIEKVK